MGIERSVVLRAGAGDVVVEVRCLPEEDHEAQLTREQTTASVHYVRWELSPSEVERFAAGPVALVIDHDHYPHEVELPAETVAELLSDLRP